MKDDFKFHVPVDIVEKADGKGGKKMVLGGIASTNDFDRQGESLLNEGFDMSFLVNSGHVNYHHRKDPASIIGAPTKAERQAGGMYIEAELYDTPTAKAAYTLTKAMAKSGRRKMGWSIEGKVLERDPLNPKIIKRAQITGVALTHLPVNQNTFATIIKAMTGDEEAEKALNTKEEEENNEPLLEGTLKSGHSFYMKGGDMIVKMATTQSMAATMPESVERGTKPQNNPPTRRTLTKGEVYERMFTLNPELSIEKAEQAMRWLEKNLS